MWLSIYDGHLQIRAFCSNCQGSGVCPPVSCLSKNSDSSFNDVIIALLWLLERLISTFIDKMYFEIVSAFSFDNRVFR